MNKLKAFFAILLTVVSLTHSRPSKAAVGAFVSTPVLITGIVIAGGAGVLSIATLASCRTDTSGLCALPLIVLAPIGILGLIVLDGEQDVMFRELSKTQANKLGISSQELAVYNDEIDQANMLMADVKSELSKIERPTAQDSGAAWSSVKDLVSPATFTVMQKIVSQK